MNTQTLKPKKVFFSFFIACLLLVTTSCGDGTSSRNIEIPGVVGPSVTLNEDDVRIAMIFENIAIDGGIRYAIPKYPNSFIEMSPDQFSSGTLMAVSVSLQDVFGDDVRQLDPQKLPGGRPLPGVLSGALPAVAFSIDSFHNMAFYLGPDVFGIFVPIDIGLQNSIATFRFYVGKSRMGNISLVGEDADGENSGFLLMLDMKGRVKRVLEDIAEDNA